MWVWNFEIIEATLHFFPHQFNSKELYECAKSYEYENGKLLAIKKIPGAKATKIGFWTSMKNQNENVFTTTRITQYEAVEFLLNDKYLTREELKYWRLKWHRSRLFRIKQP